MDEQVPEILEVGADEQVVAAAPLEEEVPEEVDVESAPEELEEVEEELGAEEETAA